MRRAHRTIWVVIVLTLCALMTPAFFFYPNILKTISPKAYAAYASGRTADALARDMERARATWGLPAWEALLREPSYLAADLTLTDIGDTLADRPPFPDGLRLRSETWRDGTLGALSARHTLEWGQKAFFLEGRLTGDALTVSAPQLYGRPLVFDPDGLGSAWNGSFLSELIELPENLSLTAPRVPEEPGGGRLETLSGAWREMMRRAVYEPAAANPYTLSLSESDGRRFLEALLAAFEDDIEHLRNLPDFNDIWAELSGALDGTSLPHCRIELGINESHRLHAFTLSFEDPEQKDSLTLMASLNGSPSPADRLTIDFCRRREGQADVALVLQAVGWITPADAGRMETEFALVYMSDQAAHKLSSTLTLDLTAAPGNLRVSADWDGTHGEFVGGYAADAEAKRISLYADSLTFGDADNTFSLSGALRCDWQLQSDAAIPPPAAPEASQPVDTLDRFEQAALLESYYRLFYHS